MTEQQQTGSGWARSLLKDFYYSQTFRAVAFTPIDAVERAIGRTDPLTPPRRLQYVGRREDFEAVGAYWRGRLVDEHGLRSDGSVLDIGCGVGRNAVALIPHLTTGRYEGFDVVPQFIRWCRRQITPRHPNFRFELADVRNRQYNRFGGSPANEYEFPYSDESFDVVFATSVFTHMRPDEIRRYMAESTRVLKPGGRLVITFFLVDFEVRELLAQRRSAFSLDHEFEDPDGTPYLGADARVPEFCIGVEEDIVLGMADGAGLERVGAVEHGSWSGRPGTEAHGYQDLVVLTKPAG